MQRTLRACSLALATGALAVAAASCSGRKGMGKGAVGVPARLGSAPAASASSAAVERPPPTPSTRVASLPDGTFGPYVGRAGDRALLLWSTPADRDRRWTARVLDGAGAPLGEAVAVGPAPAAAPRAIVRPSRDGFVAAWIEAGDGASAVRALALGNDGAARGPVVTLAQAPAEVPYVDVLATDAGLVALWAVERSGQAELHGVGLDALARPRGSAAVVASGVLAWQAAVTGRDVALAVVRAGKARAAGTVDVVRVGADGRALGPATPLTSAPTADADVDLVRVGDQAVLAWTDRRGGEPVVLVAAVDAAGKLVAPPRPVGTARGDQALVALVAPASPGRPALVVWEEPSERTTGPELPEGARTLRAATVGRAAAVGASTATLAFAASADGVPEVAAGRDGFVALTLAPACVQGATCDARTPLAPTLVTFDDALAVVASEPIRPDAFDGATATMAWALGCASTGCTVLAAGTGSPAPIAAVRADARPSRWRPVARKDREAPAPRIASLDAVASGPHVADVTTAVVGDRTLVGWVTYFVPGLPAPDDPAGATPKRARPADDPGDRKKPRAATVTLRSLDARGEPAAEPVIVSVRGESVGGVALAAAGDGSADAALAWVAKDGGDLQVFVTRVGPDGKRKAQQMLTREKGDASDVAIASAGDGWVVAWIDGRDGNGEVYAAKVDREMKRATPDVRVTDAAGDAADTTLVAVGDEVWVGWTDARGAGPTGRADPFVARLAAKDLARRGAEVLIASTGVRARAPAFARQGERTALAWVEGAGDGGRRGAARLAWLDAEARPKDAPTTLLADRAATSLAIGCGPTACRVVVGAEADGGGLSLEGLSLAGGAVGAPSTLLRVSGSSGEDVAPTLASGVLYFADDDRDGRGRVRRASIVWE